MKVMIFDLKGPFAHFRKIYTNSSSLSYSLPPRTTLAGIIAAILGWERDSYYEVMSSKKVGIAVQKITQTRKIIQTLNYIKISDDKKNKTNKINISLLSPREGHTQIPFEIICGEPEIRYRVYLKSENADIYEGLKKALQEEKSVFPIYLGAAPFSGVFEWVGEGELKQDDSREAKEIFTPVDVNCIEKLMWQDMQQECMLVKDRMPVDFLEGRYPVNTKSYLYDDRGGSIKVVLKPEAECFEVNYKDKDKQVSEHILFY